ncbi:hypothetical protein ACPTFP_31510, partial [Pseudomonas aeruginosa]
GGWGGGGGVRFVVLEMVSNRMFTEFGGISRVTYDVSSKPPASIEWD